MATPKIVTSGVTEFSEAQMNKFIGGDGTKIQVKMWYASIIYSAGSPVVDSAQDSCGLVTGSLSYVNPTLRITLSGFTNAPHVQLTRHALTTNYNVAKLLVSNTRVDVGFYAAANPSTQISAGAYDTNMRFDILIIGF